MLCSSIPSGLGYVGYLARQSGVLLCFVCGELRASGMGLALGLGPWALGSMVVL